MSTTAQDILTKVRYRLMEPVADFWTDAELLLYLNEGQNDLADQMRGIESKANMSTVALRNDYTLPQNWLSTRAVFYKDPSSATAVWRRAVATNLEKVAQEAPNFQEVPTSENWGQQVRYWIWDRTLYFLPTPFSSGSGNILMFYKAKPNEIVSLSENLAVDDLFAPAIESYVLARAWEKEKEADLAQVAWTEYNTRARRGLRWVKRQSGDQPYSMDSYSGYPYYGGGIGGTSRHSPLS